MTPNGNQPNYADYDHNHTIVGGCDIPTTAAANRYLRGVGELVDPADLVGAHEIAERLDVSRSQVVHVWRKRHDDFPEPIATLRSALIWDWSEVEAWARSSGRLR